MKRGKLQSLMGPKAAAMIHATHPRPIDVDGEQICNTSCSTTIVTTANSNCSLLLFYSSFI